MPLTVEVKVDRDSVFIGDKIKYTIEVKTEKDIEIQFPSFGENLGEFAVRDFGSTESGLWGRKTLTQWYILDIYETGTYTIPGALVKYRRKNEERWHEITTDEITIKVQSLLGKSEETAEIRDIKGPKSFYNFTYLYIFLAVIAVIIIFVAIIIYLKKRKKTKNTIPPPRPAHEIALEALQNLKRKDYPGTGKIQEYYVELSDIVRHYLENRFYLRAPEMTTEEFLSHLRNTHVLGTEHKELLREFLSHCDMVKFAKYNPDGREIESSYESAKRLIDQTKERLEEVKKG
jgi:hypothetical protein